jgi:von Willebrand factor type A domain
VRRLAAWLLSTVAVVTAAALVAGAPLSTASAGRSVRAEASVPVEVVLVLDASRSVRYGMDSTGRKGLVDDVVAAARSVLRVLAASPRVDPRAAVVSYDERVRIQAPLSTVTPETVTSGGLLNLALGDPGGVRGTLSATTGYVEHSRRGSGSNWEAALAAAQRLLGDARQGAVQIVVHVTDGEPTAHLNADGEPTLTGDLEQHLAGAALVTSRLKAADVRLLVVGVGGARSRLTTLVRVAGPGVYDQTESGAVFHPEAEDVILLADPEHLAGLFTDVLGALTMTPDRDLPAAAVETGGDIDEPAGRNWPWILIGAALPLITMIFAAAFGPRRRRQVFGAGAIERHRRPTSG